LGSGAFPYFSTIHSFATKLGGTHGKKLCQAEDMAKFDSGVQCSTEWTTPGDPSSIVFRYTHPILDVYSLAVARQVEVQFEQPAKQRDRLSSRKALSEYFKIKLPSTYEQIEAFWATNYKNLCQQYLQAFLLFKENQKIITFDDVINNITSYNFPDGNIPTFDLLIIDEAQDLSIHLWKLALRLIKNADVSLIAGDDDQAIMSGIGASPETFVSLKTSEPDNVLEQSWRIPQTVFDYVNVSVMPFLQDMPGRAEKPWLARSHKGETISAIKQKASGQEDVSVVYADLCLMDLINEVRLEFLNFRGDSSAARELSNAMNIQATSVDQKKCNEPPDWLIMSPTRASARAVSEALEEYGIPHFFRNKPVLDAVPNSCSIRVQTIHISKGAEAENTAIFVNSFGDVAMLADDPRLAYVAQTRAKERMFPRVIKSGLIGDMTGASANFSRAAYKFNKMFPKTLNTSPPDKLQMTSDGFFRDMNIPFEGLTDDEKDAW